MRLLPALVLSAALFTGACTYPDGSFNAPGTLALGAGAALAGVVIAGAANDRPRHYAQRPYYGGGRGYGYGRPAYGYGHGHGHGHRRW